MLDSFTRNAAQKTLEMALKRGATDADVLLMGEKSLSVSTRLQKLETLEHSASIDLGLRVFIGKRQAMVSSSDLSDTALEGLVEAAMDRVKLTPENKFSGLAEKSQILQKFPQVETFDAQEVTPDCLKKSTLEAESAALEVKGISNSEGSEAGYGTSEIYIISSNGFEGGYKRSSYSLSVCVLAEGKNKSMERDYDYSSTVYLEDLKDPVSIGKKAAEKAIKKINPRKVKTGRYPVIFHADEARGLLGDFIDAIKGSAVANKTSFLQNKMGEQIFSKHITITDDPLLRRGLASKPFDAEGLAAEKLTLVEKGVLKHWLLDLQTSRQLGLSSNGRASRGLASPPMPGSTNVILNAGKKSLEEMIKEIHTGYLVTDTMGFGVNMVTGEFSQGSNGFWIENGELAYPVSEVTISGHLNDMFSNMIPANDLELKSSKNSPSLYIGEMMIAGGEA